MISLIHNHLRSTSFSHISTFHPHPLPHRLRKPTFSQPLMSYFTSQVEKMPISSTSHVIPFLTGNENGHFVPSRVALYLTGSAWGRFRYRSRRALPHGERLEPFSFPLASRFTARGAPGAVFAPARVALYLTGSARDHFRSRSRRALPHGERLGPFSIPLASCFTARGALGPVFAPARFALYRAGRAWGRFRSRSRHALPHGERWGPISIPVASFGAEVGDAVVFGVKELGDYVFGEA